ncbi:MAG: LysR family transcriptional regulator [Verrucomicrobia bacterium]|nr:LysR family transcriptional regulator [Verrucomicrobiota bacterium]MBI3869787.1 LysR family transcriptional regulator [Verrucomicrobiota bacterium]
MELRHLRYFVAVAETENVSRAALTLRVSQPALSRQIRDLEEELGFLLLARGAKSVRLTDAGRLFLTESRAVLRRAEEAVKAARDIATGGSGEIHIGYAPTLTARILPPTLRAFQAATSGVRVKLHDLSTEEMLSQLAERHLHLAFTTRPSASVLRGFRFEELTREPVRLAVAPTHPLARRRVVTLANAAREPLIAFNRKEYPDYHELLANVFAATEGRPRIAEEHDGVSSLISAVEAGGGVALMPESLACVAGARLKLLPLTPAPAPLAIGAVSLKDGLTAAADTFLRCAQQTVAGK